MPTESFNGANYWVDVSYTLSGTGAEMPSGLASLAPARPGFRSTSSGSDTGGVSDDATPPSPGDGWNGYITPTTKGGALRNIALGLVAPHGGEHAVSFWCPLATIDPTLAAAITWNPDVPATAPASARRRPIRPTRCPGSAPPP